jgi:hypothetical protein
MRGQKIEYIRNCPVTKKRQSLERDALLPEEILFRKTK